MNQGLEGRTAFTDGGYFNGLDLPLLLVILFFAFFLALIYYLRREDKREGYPLVQDPRDRPRPRVDIEGFPGMPTPKRFVMPHGRPDVFAPHPETQRDLDATWPGHVDDPLVPTGDPLLAGVGAGSWQQRLDEPDLTYDGKPMFRPMRFHDEFRVAKLDLDPRGLPMVGLDRKVAGEVVDIWFDGAEHHGRFLEVQLAPEVLAQRTVSDPRYIREEHHVDPVAAVVTQEHIETPTATIDAVEVDVIYAETTEEKRNPADHFLSGDERDSLDHLDDDTNNDGAVDPAGAGEGEQAGVAEAIREGHDPAEAKGGDDYEREKFTPPAPGRVLIPIEFLAFNRRAGEVRTAAITGAQFANAPGRKSDTLLTSMEEQLTRAYFGGGIRFATPERTEPLL